MGLDMYAMITKETLKKEVDFETVDAQELHYWRKHPNLHGWMENLYYEKRGEKVVFNCTTLALDCADLDRLEAAIKSGALPDTDGFFFGESDGSEIDDDLQFIAKARDAIKDGYYVFYDSWW